MAVRARETRSSRHTQELAPNKRPQYPPILCVTDSLRRYWVMTSRLTLTAPGVRVRAGDTRHLLAVITAVNSKRQGRFSSALHKQHHCKQKAGALDL
jgi:hypothetical protein